MSKKIMIIYVMLGEVVIYLFLLLAIPAYKSWALITCATPGLLFETPVFLYFFPGIIGALIVWRIVTLKKGGSHG